MKMLVIVVLTLICFMCHSSDGQQAAILTSSKGCCVKFTRMRIPEGRIKHVEMTPGVCQLKAMVFTTVCGKEFCIDPKLKWAKSSLKDFQERTANSITTSTPVNVTCNN